jgi:enterochelin esterase family protein
VGQDAPNALLSPRLIELEEELRTGDFNALERFWQVVSNQGTPMIEPIPGDIDHVHVTFLWRGGKDTRNVVFVSALTANFNRDRQLTQDQLTLLPGTDMWWKTYRVRKDARFTYYLSPNDSLQRKQSSDWDTLQPDPLNPRRYVLPHRDRDWVTSLVELPAAPPRPWMQQEPGVPRGRLEAHYIDSQSVGNKRRIWVYTPPDYTGEDRPYHLLVLVDGWLYAKMIPTATIIDNLLAADSIHPLVAVMVEQKDRNLELSCYEPFNEFLARELIPWVSERYHVSSNPSERIIAGQSLGGLAAACAGLRHSKIFGNVLSLSGYFSWDPREEAADGEGLEFEWAIRQFAEGPKVPLRFTLFVGLFERDRHFADSPSLLQANRHMRDVLVAKGYPLTYKEVAGGHEVFMHAVTFPHGLLALAGRGSPQKQSVVH